MYPKEKGGKMYFWGDKSSTEYLFISFMAAKKSLRQGCVAYLCCVMKDRKEEVKLEDIPAVKEFPDMFHERDSWVTTLERD